MSRRILWAASVVLVTLGLIVMGLSVGAGAQSSSDDAYLHVNGAMYAPTKVVGSGPTVHYETPNVELYDDVWTQRHRWEGHGRENLPCENGIHWIDNKNVLTISHCLGVSTTTTTVPTDSTTTTTVPASTTTTTVPSTTTTSPPTCDESDPLWNEETQDCRLPFTGVDRDVLTGIGMLGLSALLLGGVLASVAALIGRRRG